jgi:hypothetical protein
LPDKLGSVESDIVISVNRGERSVRAKRRRYYVKYTLEHYSPRR